MPDGLVVGMNAEDGDQVDLNLAEYEKDFKNTKSLYIYLSIPEHRVDAASLRSEFPRFESAESGFVVNQNTGEEAPRFACLKPKLVLLAGAEPTGRFIYFPLAKVSKVKAKYVLDSFLPPLLTVPLASPLGSLCTNLAQTIRNKAAFLSEQIRQDNRSLMGQESQSHIKTMMAGLVGFESLLQTGATHPFALYVGLCQLAGHMSALRPGGNTPCFSSL
jgi:type VI secretion system protein ImpJ